MVQFVAISVLVCFAVPTQSLEFHSSYDYIVVGLGAGGSIAAARLAEKGYKVLGIEAGPPLQAANGGTVTAGTFVGGETFTIYDVPSFNPFVPAPKEQFWDVGSWEAGGHTKGIGGDGARNGALYLRAVPEDFKELVEEHNFARWSYEEALPYYIRSETNKGKGHGAHRGYSGPIAITDASPSAWDLKLMESCKAVGFNHSDDFNRPGGRNGCGIMQVNLDKGIRSSSAATFLPRAPANRLTIMPDTLVTKVVFRGKHVPRAVGVEVEQRNRKRVLHAKHEVILAGGTLNTPRLLMLSGVGPKEELAKFGLHVLADLPVGRTLRNHYTVFLEFETSEPWIFPDPTASYAEFIEHRTGYYNRTHGGAEGVVLVWFQSPFSKRGKPDIQMRLFPYNDGNASHVRFNIDLDSPTSGPGSFNLTSDSYSGTPPQFGLPVVGDEDARKLVWAIQELRKLAAAGPLASLLKREVSGAPTTEAELLQYVRESAVGCTGHWMGTVPMGTVLTEELSVKGVKGLRVADNSVWPFQLNGNTQSHAWLAGERVADFATETREIVV